MQAHTEDASLPMPESTVTARIGATRIVIGLLQGALLYGLYRAGKDAVWPATEPMLFLPLILICWLTPLMLVTGLGHVAGRRLAVWLVFACAVIAGLAYYDVWRGNGGDPLHIGPGKGLQPPSTQLFLLIIAGFYIAQSMVLAGAAERRWIASYPTYFESGWKLLIQWIFSGMFMQALWGLLWMGAKLFAIVKLDFLEKLLEEAWFVMPVLAFAFAFAIHITDVRPAIVRGIRTLLLVLMSWLLPVAAVLMAGFLVSLLWQGLAPLWATKHATFLLLAAIAMLVLLINAAFQNGTAAAKVSLAIRLCARVAALILVPMAAIAVYALSLRVVDHGWTPDRVFAAASLAVACCYALGYAWAAIQRHVWLQAVTSVNIATAFVVLAMMLAILSPLLDPARLSVHSQVARLLSGKVAADKFDYAFLMDGNTVRFGREALQNLKTQPGIPQAETVHARALAALARTQPHPTKPVDLAANIRVWPAGQQLPASFLKTDWSKDQYIGKADCLSMADVKCDAIMLDLAGNGKPAVLLFNSANFPGPYGFIEDGDGHWKLAYSVSFDIAHCEPVMAALKAGALHLAPKQGNDIDILGLRLEVKPWIPFGSLKCPKQ